MSAISQTGLPPSITRWTCDPRPDLAGDSVAWGQLLETAYFIHTDASDSVLGVLHGLRACGAGLQRDRRGAWRIVAGEMDASEYAADRDRWLMPYRTQVAELLRRLNGETR